jgi:L-methionine (R)-S-oxide reductase
VTDKEELFQRLYESVVALMNADVPLTAKLKATSDLLKERIPYYDWVGFYITDPAVPTELVLGPFAGAPTEHVRIAFGAGICGRAAVSRKMFVVQDVSRETNYLSCSPNVKAEIVLPIFRGADVWGELDIDSHTLAPFSGEDGAFLGKVCSLIGARVAAGEDVQV